MLGTAWLSSLARVRVLHQWFISVREELVGTVSGFSPVLLNQKVWDEVQKICLNMDHSLDAGNISAVTALQLPLALLTSSALTLGCCPGFWNLVKRPIQTAYAHS